MSKLLPDLRTWRADVPSSVVVALVALPLCLGVAVASGAPPLSGLIAGMVGGLVVGALSKSPLSVAGPAAGLTPIVLAAIHALPTFEAFLLAVVLAGALQVALGLTRSGLLAEFIPSSVVTGMLAAIGLILILKQIPYAIGYQGDYEGSFEFLQADGRNTLSALWNALDQRVTWGAVLISLCGLAFLFWWDRAKPRRGALRLIPGPLLVVVIGIFANRLFGLISPDLKLTGNELVHVPVAQNAGAFLGFFTAPDFSQIANPLVWKTALTLGIVASLESLLSVKAIDELDAKRRRTDKNWELFAQGGGNIVSGLIGGIPVTSVIVRSTANVTSGADSKLSTILHGGWLLLSVALIPMVLNQIPLAALAAILIATGYKLAKPALFVKRWRQGASQFVPFTVTIAAILLTDLLIGIGIGLTIGFAFVVARNFRKAITFAHDGSDYLVRARRNLYFIHKYELQETLGAVPDGVNVLIDISATSYVDIDNIEILNAFISGARARGIDVTVRGDLAARSSTLIDAPLREVRYA